MRVIELLEDSQPGVLFRLLRNMLARGERIKCHFKAPHSPVANINGWLESAAINKVSTTDAGDESTNMVVLKYLKATNSKIGKVQKRIVFLPLDWTEENLQLTPWRYNGVDAWQLVNVKKSMTESTSSSVLVRIIQNLTQDYDDSKIGKDGRPAKALYLDLQWRYGPANSVLAALARHKGWLVSVEERGPMNGGGGKFGKENGVHLSYYDNLTTKKKTCVRLASTFDTLHDLIEEPTRWVLTNGSTYDEREDAV